MKNCTEKYSTIINSAVNLLHFVITAYWLIELTLIKYEFSTHQQIFLFLTLLALKSFVPHGAQCALRVAFCLYIMELMRLYLDCILTDVLSFILCISIIIYFCDLFKAEKPNKG